MGKDAGLARPGTLNGLPIADRLNPPERSAVFDPTFEGIGWGHKRNLRPENARAKEEAYLGKRVFEAPSSSQTGDLMRSSLPILDVHARGGARQTRFTKGFNRKRPHETPEQAALKEQIHQHAADRAHTVQSNRRDYLATKASKGGCNVVTGGPPIAGEHLSYKPARLILKPKATIDKELGTADRQKELDSKHLEMAEKRRERLRCDGLTADRRQWTVREQMNCHDGYVIHDKTSQDHMQIPYKYGRRPIPRAPPVDNVFL